MIVSMNSLSQPNTSKEEIWFSLVLNKVLYVFLQNSLQRNNGQTDEKYKLMTRRHFTRNHILYDNYIKTPVCSFSSGKNEYGLADFSVKYVTA